MPVGAACMAARAAPTTSDAPPPTAPNVGVRTSSLFPIPSSLFPSRSASIRFKNAMGSHPWRRSVSKKSFRHAVRIFKLSKKFKNTCRLNAKGAFCPLHTSPAALSQTSSSRFFDSLRAHIKCAPTVRRGGRCVCRGGLNIRPSRAAIPAAPPPSLVGRHAHMPPWPGRDDRGPWWLRGAVRADCISARQRVEKVFSPRCAYFQTLYKV